MDRQNQQNESEEYTATVYASPMPPADWKRRGSEYPRNYMAPDPQNPLIFCPVCGRNLNGSQTFCPFCGAVLSDAGAPDRSSSFESRTGEQGMKLVYASPDRMGGGGVQPPIAPVYAMPDRMGGGFVQPPIAPVYASPDRMGGGGVQPPIAPAYASPPVPENPSPKKKGFFRSLFSRKKGV